MMRIISRGNLQYLDLYSKCAHFIKQLYQHNFCPMIKGIYYQLSETNFQYSIYIYIYTVLEIQMTQELLSTSLKSSQKWEFLHKVVIFKQIS